MKLLKNTTTFKRWAVSAAALILALCAGPTRAAQGILDYNRFMSEIEPLLLTRTYASPGPTPMTCFACHGDSGNAAYTAFPLYQGQPRLNFLEVARRSNLENPDTSEILLKPLSLFAGGVSHGLNNNDAGEQFLNTTTDQNYKTLQAWISEARRSSIGARVSKAEGHPNPFRYSTDIVYFLTTEADSVKVTLYSFDGSEVRTFMGTTRVGANRVTWDGRSEANEPMPTGIYVYRVKGYFDDGTHVFQGSLVYTP